MFFLFLSLNLSLPFAVACCVLANILYFFVIRKYLDEEFIWRIFWQLLKAIEVFPSSFYLFPFCIAESLSLIPLLRSFPQVCHKSKEGIILHRDLKPANIFFDDKRWFPCLLAAPHAAAHADHIVLW